MATTRRSVSLSLPLICSLDSPDSRNSPNPQKVKGEQKDAEAIGTKLTNLHNSVNNFQATLKTALEKDSAIAKQIEEVRGRIAGVDKKIAEFESLVSVDDFYNASGAR